MQGVNDVILFTVSGAGSMVSGYLYAELGWTMLLLLTVVMVMKAIHCAPWSKL